MAERITINKSYEARGANVSVTVRSEPIHHDFDERELGEGPAAAIRDAIKAGIQAITEKASQATIARRRKKNPGASDRLFNDTGRLADGVHAVARGDEWAIAAPPDRLNSNGVPDQGALERMLARLAELVPAIREPLEVPAVKRAIEQSLKKLIRVAR